MTATTNPLMLGWQNMHFAPKDGSEILILTGSGQRRIAFWHKGYEEWRSPSGWRGKYSPRMWHALPVKP